MNIYRAFILIGFIFLCQIAFAQENVFTVKGVVKNSSDDQPIVGATISWNNGKDGLVTDVNGRFEIALRKGKYKFHISAVGKIKVVREISLPKDKEVNVSLQDDVVELSEITVRSSEETDNLRAASMGVEKLSIESIEKMPALMGEVDIVKGIITLPGISSVGEGSSGFNVRGGSIGQNLVLLDEAPIFYTSHLFGFFSVFNQDIVDNVTLYKGGIPARFGGRVSSVLDVESRDPIVDSYRMSGGIGLVSSRAALTIPIIEDKLGVMVSGRTSYSDWLLNTTDNPNLSNSNAYFYDANVKLGYKIGSKSKFILSLYNGADRFGFSSDTTYRYGNFSGTLKYLQEIGDHLNLSFSAIHSDNFSRVTGDYGNRQFDLDINTLYQGIKWGVGLDINRHYLSLGGEYNIYDLDPGTLKPSDNDSVIEPISIEQDKGEKYDLYLEDKMTFDKFKVNVGVRYSYFRKKGPHTSYSYDSNSPMDQGAIVDTVNYGRNDIIEDYGGFEPRVSVNYMIDDKRSVKVGYQRTRQYLHLIANNAAIAPTDIYKLSNEHIKPQIGDQVSLGYFRNFKDNLIETSLEVYYKQVQNTIDYKDGASLLLNPILETELIQGDSESYGAEFSISKTAGRLTGRISYTYSRSFVISNGDFEDEIINEGNAYPAYYDKPHDLTSILSFDIKENISLNMNFTYSTGRPVSIPISKYDFGSISIAEFSQRNQYRIPDYHRLDLSITFDSKKDNEKRWKGSWTLGLYNVYGRKNPFSVFFRDQNGAPPQAYRLAVLGIPFPSLTYNFKFQ